MHPAASRRSDRRGSRRRRGSAEDDWLSSLRIRASGGHQMMRQSREMGLGHKRERGITLPHRNRQSLSLGTADSGGKIIRPCGDFARGRRGESERRGRAICRRGESSKRTGNKEN
jgi:hypothetical protein